MPGDEDHEPDEPDEPDERDDDERDDAARDDAARDDAARDDAAHDEAAQRDVAAGLIAALAADGAEVRDGSPGRFRLDVARAREQLREHQLAEPERYICLIVEIAALVGAKLIQIASDINELRAGFFGASFSSAELEHLADALFIDLGGAEVDERERRRRRALQLLALLGPAALRAGARELALRSGPGCLRVRVEDGEERWSFERELGRAAGTSLTLRFGWRVPGLELLRERCRHSRLPIYLDGERISLGPEAAFTRDHHRPAVDPIAVLDDEGVEIGEATITTTSEDGKGWIELLTNGWLVERVELPGGASGLHAVVEVDLRRDLAQAKVIRDAAFEAVLDAVRRAEAALLQQAKPALVIAFGHERSVVPDVGGSVVRLFLVAFAAVVGVAALLAWHPLAGFAGAMLGLLLFLVFGGGDLLRRKIERDWFDM